MKYESQDTLSYFDSLPQTKAMDLSGRSIKLLAASTKAYRKNCGQVHPDTQAAAFYTLNHCASVVRSKFTKNEPLPSWALQVMQSYSKELMLQSERMTHYLVSIITREMRHIKSPDGAPVWSQTNNKYPGMGSFCRALKSVNEDAAVTKYMTDAPDVPMSVYAAGMAYMFDNGSWSGGFGGKAWGKVAAALQALLEGKISLEMMVDTAYTLAHNNGPIFNKGMMYDHYSGQFMMILDVQHSGQMPELMLDPTIWANSYAYDPAVQSLVKLVKANVRSAFGDTVDWQKVVDMGDPKKVGNYSSQIAKQAKITPQKVVTMFSGIQAEKTGVFQVMPGVSVPVFKRKIA